MRARWWTVSAVGLFASGLAYAGLFNMDEQLTSHTKARQQYHGFSVAPPMSQEWYMRISEQTPMRAIYRRHLPSKTHTFFASVSFGELDKTLPIEQALIPGVISKPDRTDLIENTHEADTSRPTKCIRYSIRYNDKGAPNSAGPVLVTIDRGFVCVHPTIPGAGVRANFSERGLEGELDPALWENMEDFLRGVHIESAPGIPVA